MTQINNIAHIVENTDGNSFLIFRTDFLNWFHSQGRDYDRPSINILGEPLNTYWGDEPSNYGLEGIDNYRLAVLSTKNHQTDTEYVSNLITIIEHTLELFYDYDDYLDEFGRTEHIGGLKVLA